MAHITKSRNLAIIHPIEGMDILVPLSRKRHLNNRTYKVSVSSKKPFNLPKLSMRGKDCLIVSNGWIAAFASPWLECYAYHSLHGVL